MAAGFFLFYREYEHKAKTEDAAKRPKAKRIYRKGLARRHIGVYNRKNKLCLFFEPKPVSMAGDGASIAFYHTLIIQ